jgi:hypothetical protein
MLFCADPMHPRRVDDHFAGQAESMRAAGARVALIDHDALLRATRARRYAECRAVSARSGTGAG